MPRIIQSRHMAQAIPMTPPRRTRTKSQENTRRIPTVVILQLAVPGENPLPAVADGKTFSKTKSCNKKGGKASGQEGGPGHSGYPGMEQKHTDAISEKS